MKQKNIENIIPINEFKHRIYISLLNGGKKYDKSLEHAEEKVVSSITCY